MSTFAFNKIFIIESLTPNELQTGSELEKRINQWAPSQGIACQVVTYQVHSRQEWDIAWDGIYTGIEKMGNIPIIHLEMHGNQTCLGIDGGKNGVIPLEEVFKRVQHANILSHNNIFLSLAVCMGLSIIRGLKVYEPMPFCGVFGSLEKLKNNELLENYTIFYKAFLTSLNLDKAEQALSQAGINADKYQLLKPEEIFMNAYLGYLETYKTDEQIVNKAVVAASEAGVFFKDDDEKKLFIRDYRCTLLLTENKEYQRAVDEFFIFSYYPEIRFRFNIPHTIYDFKEIVGHKGNNWLLKRRELTIDDVKGVSLQILNDVDAFCRKHNIRYSLAYGSLLGAIRHKGFIPWDDDIDILMLRTDYDKFISLYNRNQNGLFSVASFETDSFFHYPFAKIVCNAIIKDELGYKRYGQAIDLFPIDKIPQSEIKQKFLFKKQVFFWNVFQMKVLKWDHNRNLLKNLFLIVVKPLTLLMPYPILHKLMRRSPLKYSSLQSEYSLGCLFSPYGRREAMPKDVFSDFEPMPFEQSYYYCIKNYDTFLKNVYGDYMKLPPVEKRVTHHAFDIWWK